MSVDDLKDLDNCPRSRPCEHCGYSTRPGWAAEWRVWCRGCGSTHLLCVDCGLALGRTRNNWPVWADMDACPDDVAMLLVLTGKDTDRPGLETVRAVLREHGWVEYAIVALRKLGIPVQREIAPESVDRDGDRPGVLLMDGREVYPRP